MGDQDDTLISKLDFGDPLYLHASDTSSVPLIGFKLKGTENYKSWSSAMLLALKTKNKVGFVDGNFKKSQTNDVLASQWDRCNAVVLSWILGSVSDDLYSGQIYSTVASEVWQELKETYDKVDGSVIFNLHHKINSLTQNGSSVSDYYHRLNSLWRQYDIMLKLPSCVCDASKEFQQHTTLIKLMQFLMGLDDSYQPIRSNILTQDPLPSVKVAFSLISREESHRSSSSSDVKPMGHSSAFISKFSQSKNVSNSDLKCKKCSRTGHTIDRCFEIIGYPPKTNSNVKCTKCGRSGHSVDKCFEVVGYPSTWKRRNNNTVLQNSSGSIESNTIPPSLSQDQISKLLSLLDGQAKDVPLKSNMAGFEVKTDLGDW